MDNDKQISNPLDEPRKKTSIYDTDWLGHDWELKMLLPGWAGKIDNILQAMLYERDATDIRVSVKREREGIKDPLETDIDPNVISRNVKEIRYHVLSINHYLEVITKYVLISIWLLIVIAVLLFWLVTG